MRDVGLVAAFLLALSVVWTVAPMLSAAAAAGDPFGAARPTVFVAQSPSGGSSQLYRAETTNTGDFAFLPEGAGSAGLYNAISWRPADGYLYGMAVEAIGSIPSGSLIRIGEGGTATRVGTDRYAHSGNATRQYEWYAGAFNPDDGLFYVADGGAANNPVTVIDVDSGAVVRTFDLSPSIPAGQDFEFLGGYLWSMTATGAVNRIDVSTGGVTQFPGVAPADSAGYGGAWEFGNGNLGFSGNDSGRVVQLRIDDPSSANPAFTVVAAFAGPPSTNNDGAAIPGAPADLSILKSGPTQFTPGGQLTYTLAVTNDGSGESSGWVVTDDLPAGLTAASASGVAGETCTIAGGTNITCYGGRLGPGQSATITVVADSDAAGGASACVTNVAEVVGNESDPDSTGNQSQSTSCTPGALVVSKTVNPSSGTSVIAGQSLTYTVTFQNVGGSPIDVAHDDVVSGILDDAAVVSGPISSDSALTVSPIAADRYSISGTLAGLQTVTISYTVRVLPDNERGDDLLANFVVPAGAVPPAVCAAGDPLCTQNPVAGYSVVKTASASSAAPGDLITYTVTVTNTGRVEYPAGAPASFVDDLTSVIDDATYNDDASAGATFTAPLLSWQGALPVGGTAVIRYSVTVDDPDGGDMKLTNTVSPTATGGECVNLGSCTTDTPIGSYTVTKTVDADSARSGQKVTYTVTLTNTGRLGYTEGAPASFTDDLSGVLDDATYDGDATGGAEVRGGTLYWSGPLPVESTVQIRYSVTPKSSTDGDRMLRNTVTPTSSGGTCPEACATVTPVMSYSVSKRASVSEAAPGSTVTYTVTVKNTGRADYTDADPASFTDDLTRALKQASYDGDVSNNAVYASPVVSWSGPLSVGQTVTVRYSMTVNADASGRLFNVVVTPAYSGGNCPEGSGNLLCAATTPITPPGARVGTGGSAVPSAPKAAWTALIWLLVLLAGATGWIVSRGRRRDQR